MPRCAHNHPSVWPEKENKMLIISHSDTFMQWQYINETIHIEEMIVIFLAQGPYIHPIALHSIIAATRSDI